MRAGSFVVVVPAKSLEPCSNGMTRATHDLELQQHFAGVDWGGKSFDMHFLSGGGLAIDTEQLGHGASFAAKDKSMAVFNGCGLLSSDPVLTLNINRQTETPCYAFCNARSLYVSDVRCTMWVACTGLNSNLGVWAVTRPF